MSHPDVMAVPERGAVGRPSTAPARGTHLPRNGRGMIMSIVAALMLAMCATLFGTVGSAQAANPPCPGGSASGTGGQQCPSLHNADIDPERSFPRDLYRGDSRPPEEIFRDGFTARGTNDDLVAHVHGGDGSLQSNYISTTGTLSMAEKFARSQGTVALTRVEVQPSCGKGRLAAYALIPGLGPFLMSSCLRGEIVTHSYVYVIDPTWARNALYVTDQLWRERPNLAHTYTPQDEWAYVHHIPNYAIVGVRIYRMRQATTNGRINPLQGPTMTYERYAPNPNHIRARFEYDPAQDAYAHWGFNTDLIVGNDANPYTRGCSAVERCKGGNG